MNFKLELPSEAALRAQPGYPASLLPMAAELAQRGHPALAVEALYLALASGQPLVEVAARKLLWSLFSGYHLPMMNDPLRNQAWDRALRKAIRPGMKVLEIGTGAGMLAMMAARAGAQVITCEHDQAVVEVARRVIARNGLSAHVRILPKSSLEVQIGEDLEQPADLLFCDNFADNMFGFRPLEAIEDARVRLLKPEAAILPATASVRLALMEWDKHDRYFSAGESCGFDLADATVFIPDSMDVEAGDPGLLLHSKSVEAYRFDFRQPVSEHSEIVLEANHDCRVTGIAQWIRLELDEQNVLESRPQPGVHFSNPRCHPFAKPLNLQKGARIPVQVHHDQRALYLYPLLPEP